MLPPARRAPAGRPRRAAARSRDRAGGGRPVPAGGGRRAPHRLGRHRAQPRAARLAYPGRARSWRPGSCVDETASMASARRRWRSGDLAAWAAAARWACSSTGRGNRARARPTRRRRDAVAGGPDRGRVTARRWSDPWVSGSVPTRRPARRRRPSPRRSVPSSAAHRRPGVRVVVTDLLEPDGRTDRPFPWEPAVRRLAARHDVVVVEVLDPRELDLPDVGLLVLGDPETGRRREVWTSPRLRSRLRRGRGPAPPQRLGGAALVRRRRTSGCGPTPTGSATSPASSSPAGARRGPPLPEDSDDLPVPVVAAAAAPRPGPRGRLLLAARRRRRYAVRFTALPMLENLAPRSPGWRRHAPATAFVLALLDRSPSAVARPEMDAAGAARAGDRHRRHRRLALDGGHRRRAEPARCRPGRRRDLRRRAPRLLQRRRRRRSRAPPRCSSPRPTTTTRSAPASRTSRLADSTAIGEAVFTSLDLVERMAPRLRRRHRRVGRGSRRRCG